MDEPKHCSGVKEFWRVRHCARCQLWFVICPPCWRGQKYCSIRCQQIIKKVQHRKSQRKYAETPGFKEYRSEYQKQYRLEIKNGPHSPPSKQEHSRAQVVTDATSNHLKTSVIEIKTRCVCHFCGRRRIEDG